MHYTKKQKQAFLDYIGAKSEPNEHEKKLLVQAQRYARLISWMPGIRMIAVCNSLSFYATLKHSDIDLFIVTAPHRMWLVRIFVSGLFTLLGVRRRNLGRIKSTKEDIYHHYAGKFCLSFFCTTDALHFSHIALDDDIYLHFWMRYLKPIVDIDATFQRCMIENSLTKYEMDQDFMKYIIVDRSSWKWEMWKIFDWGDEFCRKLFLPRTIHSYTELGKPFGVVIHEHMLKFHDTDRRKEIRDIFIPH